MNMKSLFALLLAAIVHVMVYSQVENEVKILRYSDTSTELHFSIDESAKNIKYALIKVFEYDTKRISRGKYESVVTFWFIFMLPVTSPINHAGSGSTPV